MKKKIMVVLLLTLFVFIAGCSKQPDLGDLEYQVIIKAVDSADQVIETAVITVNGKAGTGGSGVYTFKLRAGTYTAQASDTSGRHIDTSSNFIVRSDSTVKVNMFRNEKNIQIEALDQGGSKLSRAIISIDGVDGTNFDGTYQFSLGVGEEYTVNIVDPHGFYQPKTETITVTKDTGKLSISLAKAPTGTVQGDLYLTTTYSPAPLIMEYGFINYFDMKITSGKGGYSITLPAGERELTVTTNFGGETTEIVNVVAGHTTTLDINVPLPGNFPVDVWMNGFAKVPMVSNSALDLVRWNQSEITYFIDYTDWVKSDYSDHEISLMADIVRESVQVFDQVLGDVIDYQEVFDQASADIHFLFCKDGDSNIGKAQGKCSNEINTDRMIYQSKIYLNASHVCNLYTGPPIVVHELGHSLGVGHSPNSSDLMYFNPHVIVEDWANTMEGDRMIFGLIYSLPFPTVNPFVP